MRTPRIPLAIALILALALMAHLAAPTMALDPINWSDHPANPVLTSAEHQPSRPSVAFDPNKFGAPIGGHAYLMWAQRGEEGGITLWGSNDGITWSFRGQAVGPKWERLIGSTAIPQFDFSKARNPCVLYDSGGFGGGTARFKIWFWNGTEAAGADGKEWGWGIWHASSLDGLVWVANQSITGRLAGSGYRVVGPADILYQPGAPNSGASPYGYSYVMLYLVKDAYNKTGLSLAYSANGIDWTRYGSDSILKPGGDGEWDWKNITSASIVKNPDGTYGLWYAGDDGTGQGLGLGIGYAFSNDGLVWTKLPPKPLFNPILKLSPGSWRGSACYAPKVLYSPTKFNGFGDSVYYKMWYAGRSGASYAIGYASVGPSYAFYLPTGLNALDCRGVGADALISLSTSTDGTLTISRSSTSPVGPPPAGLKSLNKFLSIEATGLTIAWPAMLRIYYEDSEVPLDIDPASLRLYRWDGSSWAPLPTASGSELGKKYLQAQITALGAFAPMGGALNVQVYQVQYGSASYNVRLVTNSSLSGFIYDEARRLMNFTLSGPDGTTGYCRATFAKALIRGTPVVFIDGREVTYAPWSANETHYQVYFLYLHSAHSVTIGGSIDIPEFGPSPPLAAIALASAAIALRRIGPRRRKIHRRLKELMDGYGIEPGPMIRKALGGGSSQEGAERYRGEGQGAEREAPRDIQRRDGWIHTGKMGKGG
ncbi:MAG: hypothetical protein QXL32_06555 [Candidatus Bathyarchaeia archaeon]